MARLSSMDLDGLEKEVIKFHNYLREISPRHPLLSMVSVGDEGVNLRPAFSGRYTGEISERYARYLRDLREAAGES